MTGVGSIREEWRRETRLTSDMAVISRQQRLSDEDAVRKALGSLQSTEDFRDTASANE